MAALRAAIFEAPQPGPGPALLQIGCIEQRPDDWIPLYDSPGPASGLSINTQEGWNALAARMEARRANRVHA